VAQAAVHRPDSSAPSASAHPAPAISDPRSRGIGEQRGEDTSVGHVGSTNTNSLVIIARLLLLIMAAALAAMSFALAWNADADSAASALHYGCPMHPEVTSPTPGECSICRMALEPVKKKPDAEAATMPAVVSSAAGVESFSLQSRQQQLIAPATRRVVTEEVIAPAWLEAHGRVVALLYKDELVGLSPGERGVFLRSKKSNASIEVRLTDDAPTRWDEGTVQVHFRADPDSASASGNVAPTLPKPEPAAGAGGWVKLAPKSRELLLVPSPAVLRSAKGPYALVAGDHDHHFIQRDIEIGQVHAGHLAVLSGLREGERIVVGNAFFVDAERRLRHARQAAFEGAP
jgi:hypothetical protein